MPSGAASTLLMTGLTWIFRLLCSCLLQVGTLLIETGSSSGTTARAGLLACSLLENRFLPIETEAFMQGWGAVCKDVHTGDQENHINYLELLAAMFAVKAFTKYQEDVAHGQQDSSVLCQLQIWVLGHHTLSIHQIHLGRPPFQLQHGFLAQRH